MSIASWGILKQVGNVKLNSKLCFCCMAAASALMVPLDVYAQSITNQQLIELSRQGLPAQVLIAMVQRDNSLLVTTPEALIELTKAGVSPDVLSAMVVAPPSARQQAARIPVNSSYGRGMIARGRIVAVSGEVVGNLTPLTPSTFDDFTNTFLLSNIPGLASEQRFVSSDFRMFLSLPIDVYDPKIRVLKVKPSNFLGRKMRSWLWDANSDRKVGDILSFVADTKAVEDKERTPLGYNLWELFFKTPLVPGEYVVRFDGRYYDFGVD